MTINDMQDQLLIKVLNGPTPREIANADIYFIQKTRLSRQIAPELSTQWAPYRQKNEIPRRFLPAGAAAARELRLLPVLIRRTHAFAGGACIRRGAA